MFRPSFDNGSILKKNMLEALRDFPYEFMNLEYADYGDGIISGFQVEAINENQFEIMPGICKIGGQIFVMTESFIISQVEQSHYVYLSILESDKPDGTDYDVDVSQYEEENNSLLELFRYTKNATVSHYKDIYEVFSEPMNRINQKHCAYSYKNGNSLCEHYFKLYAHAVLKSSNASAKDLLFAYQCLNSIKDIDIIKCYFGDVTSKLDIVHAMENKLKLLNQHEKELPKQSEKKERPKQMIVT